MNKMPHVTDEDKLNRAHIKKTAKIFAIGGGKGGIGKTVITASLGVELAAMNKNVVVVVDADLGGANLHNVFGIERPQKTFYHFFRREVKDLDDILIGVPDIDHLKIMCGARGSMGIANLNYSQKMKFIRHLKKIDADFVILDLGAGTNYNVLDLFLAADQGIVLINPDPLSILDGYNFVKQAFYRKLMKSLRGWDGPFQIVKEQAGEEIDPDALSVKELLPRITEIDPNAGEALKTVLNHFRPMLLMNMMVESYDEANGLAVKIAAQDLLSVEMKYLGVIHWDDGVMQSVGRHIPFISYDPQCQASRDLKRIIESDILEDGELQPISEKQIEKKTRIIWEHEKGNSICNEKCIYWEDCTYKVEDRPCKLFRLLDRRNRTRER